MKKLILASKSPRRRELLEQMNIPYTLRSSHFVEKTSSITDERKSEWNARLKAKHTPLDDEQEIILTADTIVVFNNTVFEKPINRKEAYDMIQLLSGNIHEVHTSVALRTYETIEVFTVKTKVEFWPLTEAEITSYINSKEPYDKAGGYGIQGKAAAFIKQINGDYYNVVGLPVSYVLRKLSKLHFPVRRYMYEMNM